MYSNKLITLFFLLPLLCHAVEFDETLYNNCKDRAMLLEFILPKAITINLCGMTTMAS